MKRIVLLFVFSVSTTLLFAQDLTPLTVEKIMRDPKWMGVSPSNISWSDDSKSVYFNWNPEKVEQDPIYKITTGNFIPQKATTEQEEVLRHSNYVYTKDRSKAVFERNGDLFLYSFKNNKETALTNTIERESNPQFSLNEDKIYFQKGENLFSASLESNELSQLTNFSRNKERKESTLSTQNEWLKVDQLEQFDITKVEKRKKELQKENREKFKVNRPKEIYLEDKSQLSNLQISPDGRFVTFRVTVPAEGNKSTIVPNYVTESGYTEDIPTRTKVGNKLSTSQTYLFDIERDSSYVISTKNILGIKDLPAYLSDYPERLASLKEKNADREVTLFGPFWNSTATHAVVIAYSQDNKDRWLLELNPINSELTLIDRQHDDAWIGGPGISGYEINVGWVNSELFYFQSEETGYSHLYTYNFKTKQSILAKHFI